MLKQVTGVSLMIIKVQMFVGLSSLACFLAACGGGQPSSDGSEQSPESTLASQLRPSDADMIADFRGAIQDASASQGAGAPALWCIADEDTTIHLFGTVHLLPPELDWRTDPINRALALSDTIVFETDTSSPEAQQYIAAQYQQRGMFNDGRRLRDVLNSEDEAVIRDAFRSVGVNLDRMDPVEPWMASVNLGVLKMINDGHDPNFGVERVLAAEARESGKSIAYLETLSDQIDTFDLLPEVEQVNILYNTALLLDEAPQFFDALVNEWADGDVYGLERLAANPHGFGSTQAAYQVFFVERNQAWVPQIEAMLEESGSVFVAVGAGHLAGPDSVIGMLRDRGHLVDELCIAEID